MDFLAGKPALPPVLGVWIGGDQRERGPVIPADPGHGGRVEHIGAITQPQHELAAALRDSHPQLGRLGEAAAIAVDAAGRIEHGLGRRSGQAQPAAQILDRNVLVRQQLRLDPMGFAQQRPPRLGFGRQPAGQRSAALHSDVAPQDPALAGQRGQHCGVPGQQHRALRHRQLVRPLPQRRRRIAGNRRLVLEHTGHRLAGPPRDRAETASDQLTTPVIPASVHSRFHRIFPSAHRCHGATCR
jgi:hypothetical protein